MNKLLLIDLNYSRDEVNEPINVDTVLDSLGELLDGIRVQVCYQTLGDTTPYRLDDYDIVLVSTKVSSGDALEEILSTPTETPVVVGGVLATYAFDQILAQYPKAILSLGECEQNIKAIVGALLSCETTELAKKELIDKRVSGLAFCYGSELYHSDIRPFDLSSITEPLTHRALLPTMQAGGLVRIEGSRGCPWNGCSFCACNYKYRCAFRPFPLEKTLGEIKQLADAGVKTLYFTDEDFFGNRDHFFSLFGEIVRQKNENILPNDLELWGSTSVFTLNRFAGELDNAIAIMKKAGIGVLFLGIESGSDSQLKRFNKGVTKEDNLLILEKLREANINVDVGFIMFDALTTLDEVRENLAFTRVSGLDKTVSRLAKPLRVIPHTQMALRYKELGLLTSEPDISELNHTYRIQDEKVSALYSALQELDLYILSTANRLQAKIRMDSGYGDSSVLDKLLSLRREEYRFIEDYLELFYNDPLDPVQLNGLLASYINRLSSGRDALAE